MSRDDFSKPLVETLRKRAGERCSYPMCRRSTVGPHSDPEKSASIGVAAHITAAAPGGPRYDASVSAEFRKSAANGIWLCQTCSRIIDVDDPRYPVTLLNEWKEAAEERARKAYEDPVYASSLIEPFSSLETRPEKFAGRIELLERMKQVLRGGQGPRFLLHGEPGNGKSLTALECAWQLAEEATSGFHAVIYQTCGRDDQLRPRDARTVGLELASKLPDFNPTAPPEQQLSAAQAWLGNRPVLLVLDDVWSDDLLDLVPASPRLSLLVTSRQEQRFEIAESENIQGFAANEAEQFFAERIATPYWPAQRLDLLKLAEAFEGSPYALAVAASLLKKKCARPFAEVLAGLGKGPAAALKDGRRDVSALLRQALDGCSPGARDLITGVAYCSPQGVWLPFAARVAGLDLETAHGLVEEWAEAALLRVLNREESTVGLHSLLRKVLREGPGTDKWSELHAAEAQRQFAAWSSDKAGEWQNCHRVLEEAILALDWLENQEDVDPFFWLAYRIFDLGRNTGQLEQANLAASRYRAKAERIDDQRYLQASLGNQALILQAWGRLDEAMALLKEQERICRELCDWSGLQASLGNQALILQALGRLDEAMALHNKEVRICRKLVDWSGLQASLGNQALILKAWGRLKKAMALHKEQERICRELCDWSGLEKALCGQALIVKDWGRLDEAMDLLKEQERICRELGDRSGLQRSLGTQALIVKDWGRLDEAMDLLKEQERICRELGDRSSLQRSLGNQGLILKAWGRLDEAMALHKEEERISRELGDRSGLQWSLGNQALILQDWGRLDDAMALHKEEERICRELASGAGLAYSLANQGQLCRQFQPPDLTAARHLLTEAVRLMTEIGMPRERELFQGWLYEISPPAK